MGVTSMPITFETIKVERSNPKIVRIIFNRLADNNSMNGKLIAEITQVVGECEKDPQVRLVVLEGQNGLFCTGMDFKEISSMNFSDTTQFKSFVRAYLELLKLFTTTPLIVISKVDGRANAGGIGFVSASDFVFATPKAEFGLSEALFGLLPANVLPFLIRRIGFQKAYHLTLTTQPVNAQKAAEIGLVDVVVENPDAEIQKLLLRLDRIAPKTVTRLKDYFKKMWIINPAMEELAIDTITDLAIDPVNREGIKRFVEQGVFPWQK